MLSTLNEPVFTSRPFTMEDHAEISKWWMGHYWPVIPLSSLPEGVVVDAYGQPAVAGFIYRTNSDIGIMEWIISNPNIPVSERNEGLNHLFDALLLLAKSYDIRILFSFFNRPRLIERAEKFGFKITDKNMTHLIREI